MRSYAYSASRPNSDCLSYQSNLNGRPLGSIQENISKDVWKSSEFIIQRIGSRMEVLFDLSIANYRSACQNVFMLNMWFMRLRYMLLQPNRSVWKFMGLHGGAAKVRSYPEFRGTRQYVKRITFQQSWGDKGKIMPVVCADSRSPKKG